MDNDAAYAGSKFQVHDRFQVAGIVRIGLTIHADGSHGLCSHKPLPVNMCNRRRLPHVSQGCDNGRAHHHSRSPDGAHGDIGPALDVHSIGNHGAAALVGFAITAFQTIGMQQIGEPVKVLGQQLFQCYSPVQEEFLSCFGRPYDMPGKGWHPWKKVISATGFELFRQRQRPVGASSLPAVVEHIIDLIQGTPGGILIHFQILSEVAFPGLRIQFVHLKPGSFCRGRRVHLSGKGPSEAEDLPVPFGDIPSENAIFIVVRQVLDLRVIINPVLRSWVFIKVFQVGKGCFCLSSVNPGNAGKTEFGKADAAFGRIQPQKLKQHTAGNECDIQTENACRNRLKTNRLLRHGR